MPKGFIKCSGCSGQGCAACRFSGLVQSDEWKPTAYEKSLPGFSRVFAESAFHGGFILWILIAPLLLVWTLLYYMYRAAKALLGAGSVNGTALFICSLALLFLLAACSGSQGTDEFDTGISFEVDQIEERGVTNIIIIAAARWCEVGDGAITGDLKDNLTAELIDVSLTRTQAAVVVESTSGRIATVSSSGLVEGDLLEFVTRKCN